MSRLKEFDPQKALDAAMTQFWQHGYSGTSITDLVESTGVAKYGLYSTFGDKRKLFMTALSRFNETQINRLVSPLEREGAALQAIRDYFHKTSSLTASRNKLGCLMCLTALEIRSNDRSISSYPRAHFKRLHKAFTACLSQARSSGDLPPAQNVEACADFLVGMVQGLASMIRSGSNHDAVKNFVNIGLSMLDRSNIQAISGTID